MENHDAQDISRATPFVRTYFHGTRADLKPGDLIEVGFNSNYGGRIQSKYIFMSATLDAAVWGAELAFGDDSPRIYIVEPTGTVEDDPDLTDRKFPGNPTKSYRSKDPFKVLGEVIHWAGHSHKQIEIMKHGLQDIEQRGIPSSNDE